MYQFAQDLNILLKVIFIKNIRFHQKAYYYFKIEIVNQKYRLVFRRYFC